MEVPMVLELVFLKFKSPSNINGLCDLCTLEPHYDSVVDELQQSYLGSTLVTYPVDPPTSTSHIYLGTYHK